MLHNSFDEKGQALILEMRNYFLESGLQNCANAFEKAISEVVVWESTGFYNNHYNKNVNKYLCEALLHVNSDNKCSNKYRTLVRSLIESYRNCYGLSTEDFGFEYNI